MSWFKKKHIVDLPTPDWIQEQHDKVKHTADAPYLERKEKHLLFVPDELMQRHREHHRLEEPTFLGTGFTNDTFSFFKYRNSGSPVPIALDRQFQSNPYSIIKGELYFVSPDNLIDIDYYKENEVQFIREKRIINIPFRPSRHPWVEGISQVSAWMYLAIPAVWEDQLDGGYEFNPVRLFESRRQIFRHYYHYTRMELDE